MCLVLKLTALQTADIYPYGLLDTSGELDEAILRLDKVLQENGEACRDGKRRATCSPMKIEKTRRRVNALEYVMISRHGRDDKVH